MGHPKCNCTEMYNAGWKVWRCPVHQWESGASVLKPSSQGRGAIVLQPGESVMARLPETGDALVKVIAAGEQS